MKALDNETNWLATYSYCLACGIVDPAFHLANFAKLPVLFLRDVLEAVGETRKQNINAKSIATAKLSSIVISALGGKNTKHKLEEFLPYELPKASKSLKESTKAAIAWALKNEKLPPSIVGLIGAELG